MSRIHIRAITLAMAAGLIAATAAGWTRSS